jgi:Fe-Mn family superoxide dismutase
MTDARGGIHHLPDLPYPRDALAPHLSAESFDYHYGKHHAAYVAKLNQLLTGHDWASLALTDLVVTASRTPGARAIFNNAAQHWNHSQFWAGMKAQGGGAVPAALERRIVDDFGSVASFKQAFVAAGAAQFGSGWVWLVESQDRLEIVTTSNADTPITESTRALITCDVWEHAYYVDYRNARADFLTAYLNHLVNWEEAARRLEAAQP